MSKLLLTSPHARVKEQPPLTSLSLLASMHPPKPPNIPRGRFLRQLEPGLLGKELHNARGGAELTFLKAFMHLPLANISTNNTLWGYLVAGDFRRQNPKVSWPRGLHE